MGYMEEYRRWLTDPTFDEETKAELAAIEHDPKEIEERFYKELEFGTGGLRGIMGAGTNRMNRYTVGRATQGLADYLKQAHPGKKLSVAIAYDSRHQSSAFAERAGLVLAGNGIKAYVFDSLRPTPVLSFTVRYLGCDAGIVITASHNPPQYNGYKVYGEDGGQGPYPKDGQIIEKVNAITDFSKVRSFSRAEAERQGLYEVIGETVDRAYLDAVKKISLHPELGQEMGGDLKIVYTPLHGTGNLPVRRLLSELGYRHVFVVPEQELPDGNFTTVGYPNPEDPKVFTLAIGIAQKEGADVIIATDPDADRVGVMVKNDAGAYVVLTGNMTGALLAEYVLSQRKALGKLPANGALVKTIVSTEMVRPIAAAYGVKVFDVLTGFKYIGEKIKEFEQSGAYTYLFGFEESYGSLAGTYARDKDAVAASMLVAEMTAYYKKRGMTLYDGLLELYQKYGYYQEKVRSLTFEGIEGAKKIAAMMEDLRQNPPTSFAGRKVAWVRDYQTRKFHNLLTGAEEEDTLPPSNVLHYTLETGDWVCVRPSGTEPKIKIYYGVKADSMQRAEEAAQAVDQAICQRMGVEG